MTLAELLKQKAELERQIANAQSETRLKAIADVQSIMREHGLNVSDLTSLPKRANKVSSGTRHPVAAKYRDDQGNSWSGRGLKPKWLTAALAGGKKMEDFAI